MKMKMIAALFIFCAVALGQAQYRVLYSFSGGTDGFAPQSLIFDHSGNLYGTTFWGGAGNPTNCGSSGCGTVFRLSPDGSGGWSETVLYTFCSQFECPDGAQPNGGLVLDSAGNLYGTTLDGGAAVAGGVVFELSPTPNGPWTETVLYSFCYDPCPTGFLPANAIARDSAGNLYGATSLGGTCNVQSIGGCGTVFELSPPSRQGGPWTESVLYNFCSTGTTCPDGFSPVGGMTLDTHGNLFGTTEFGGSYVRTCRLGCGTIFKLSPTSGGWTYSLLYAPPSPSRGDSPLAPLTISSTDTVYGSFQYGGRNQLGALFEIPANGKGSEFSFPGNPGSLANPMAGLVLGRGLISGSTYGKGSGSDPGNVFQLTSSGHETVLYTFCSQSNCTDGDGPLGLTQDGSGNLYGVAFQGGNPVCNHGLDEPPGCGVVFEITPSR